MNRNDTQFMAQKIRTQYIEKEHTELDELRTLDKRVKRPASIFSYVFGSIGAIVMGAGMSLVMTDIGAKIAGAMGIGIGVGAVGLVMAIATYPIYKKILASRKKRYSSQILELSEKIINK
ncbi:MAG: dihydropteridine reductase [Clostridia bacterium]|nr:dihydropteridine reductase [Clostridia bacterium]